MYGGDGLKIILKIQGSSMDLSLTTTETSYDFLIQRQTWRRQYFRKMTLGGVSPQSPI